MDKFTDRRAAGKFLAAELKSLITPTSDAIVLGLPRGGIPVAYEIATEFSLPLDVFIVRKLGVPNQPELAMGAIASENIIVLNEEIAKQMLISQPEFQQVLEKEQKELLRREETYRHKQPSLNFAEKTIILVDDGIATGATMRVAIKALRQQKPATIIVAVPVAPYSTCEELSQLADKLVCPLRPHNFYAVGTWYDEFSQTTDEEVCELLNK